MARALVIVDIQNDYFPGGRCELVGPEQAAERASAVLEGFRERGEPVFHVQHVWEGDDAEYLAPGTPGVEIHESVRPAIGMPRNASRTPSTSSNASDMARAPAPPVSTSVPSMSKRIREARGPSVDSLAFAAHVTGAGSFC